MVLEQARSALPVLFVGMLVLAYKTTSSLFSANSPLGLGRREALA